MAFTPDDPVLPDVRDARFDPGQAIDNPYSPFIVGDLLSYVTTAVDSDELEERGDVFVTSATRMIEGVKATVVRDTVYDDQGRWVEDTLDWYAQDAEGNVWYLGESSFSFEYDEGTGEFLGASPDGSWEWGVDGALAGVIRPAESVVGDSYYQEFYLGVAEDAAQVLDVDAEVAIGAGAFEDVIKTFDFSTFEATARELKYAAAGVGVIFEEGLDEDDEVEEVTELVGSRSVSVRPGEGEDVPLSDLKEGCAITPEEIEKGTFAAEQDEDETFSVAYLGGVDDLDNAVGVYEYDLATGEIGEGRILFASTDRVETGTEREVDVAAGKGLGVFMISGAGASGIDLTQCRDGGLAFRNIAADGPARLGDPLSPVATTADGDYLPFTVFHGFDADHRDGVNLLNAGAALQATELELPCGTDDDEMAVIGFEDRMATDPLADADYNDVVLSVSDDPLSDAAVAEIAAMFGSEVYDRGTTGADRLMGRAFDDLLIGLGGDDLLKGGRGDDDLRGGAGHDVARFHGDVAGFSVEADARGRTIVTDVDLSDGDLGRDMLTGIEALRFDDGLLLA